MSSPARIAADRPAVRVNQVGYATDGPKRATLVSDAVDPVDFRVEGAAGTVLRGSSRPWPQRPDPASGLAVHVLDFSGLADPGEYRVRAGAAGSHPFRVGERVYGDLAADALGFFRRMRCRHAGDVAVPAWTGPDAERLYPGWHAPGRFDVSGGWYDAGDHGKYVVSGAIAAWQLLAVTDLAPVAPVLDECRWQLDWLLRMQVPEGHPLAGTAFHRVHGTTWSPLPGRPEDDPTERVLHRPSATATLHLAAVAARGARAFAASDPDYAARLLAAARAAHAAARRHPDLVAPDDAGAFGGGPYPDDDPTDDAYWAAAELYLATGEPAYEAEVIGSQWHTGDAFDPAGFDYDRVAAPARLDLAAAPSALPDRARVRESVVEAADRLVRVQAAQPWEQPYDPPQGYDWGSTGRVLNNLVVLVTAHRLTGERRFRDAVLSGLDYVFGRNGLGQSYVVGHGTDHTRRTRARMFGHALDPSFPPPPAGAVAGGPTSRDYPGFPADPELAGLPPQLRYLDEPTSETTNDVCIRWNAPLVHVATHLDPGWAGLA